MKSFKFLLPILAGILCLSWVMTGENRTRGIVVSEAMGLAAARCGSSFVERACEISKAAGLGFGASILLQEWQNQQALELETLISRNGVI
ncbi:conserved hypothetical protein [Chlamydia felis Fe/C-56]|uniref:Uncharacterized protein n=1 Tax=Chlamydia felis (strain Fe/C-56) TaxID=264202 RepID=Q255S9_CHLFF|nr:hypothetical protein [Chlamydia felis]BAE80959.1 conserved hypothetical protein [Chlamydia felis Fe/C-56]